MRPEELLFLVIYEVCMSKLNGQEKDKSTVQVLHQTLLLLLNQTWQKAAFGANTRVVKSNVFAFLEPLRTLWGGSRKKLNQEGVTGNTLQRACERWVACGFLTAPTVQTKNSSAGTRDCGNSHLTVSDKGKKYHLRLTGKVPQENRLRSCLKTVLKRASTDCHIASITAKLSSTET